MPEDQRSSTETERERLAGVAEEFDSGAGFNGFVVRQAADVVASHVKGPKVLEMGCASGVSTERFLREPWELWVVEGAEKYAERARELFVRYGTPPERVLCMLFEEFEPSDQFDDIVMAYILEHVEDPEALLRRVVGWLKPGGRLHICVPNADSLHRKLGVAMGLCKNTTDLSEADKRIGHRRVFTKDALDALVYSQRVGLTYPRYHTEAIMLKPFPNTIMDKVARDPAIVAGLAVMAHRYVHEASDHYACFEKEGP